MRNVNNRFFKLIIYNSLIICDFRLFTPFTIEFTIKRIQEVDVNF